MGFITFIKGLFQPTPERLAEIEGENKKRILIVLARKLQKDGHGILPLPSIYREFCENSYLSAQAFIEMVNGLVKAGFVQRIDGGNKQLAAPDVSYVISGNGLNHLGLPDD